MSSRPAHGNRSSRTSQRRQDSTGAKDNTKTSPKDPLHNDQPTSGTMKALDAEIAELESKLSVLKQQRIEVKEREDSLTPQQTNLLKNKSPRKLQKDLGWLQHSLKDLRFKAVHAGKSERQWAQQRLPSVRSKIADAIRVLAYVADKRNRNPPNEIVKTSKFAIHTLIDGEEVPIPPGYTVHLHNNKVVDYYRAAAIIKRVQVQDQLTKFWLKTVLVQCRLHKELQAQHAAFKRAENQRKLAQKEKESLARHWFVSLVRQAALQKKLQVAQQEYEDCRDEYLWYIEETKQQEVPKEPPPKPPPPKPKQKRGKSKHRGASKQNHDDHSEDFWTTFHAKLDAIKKSL